MNVVSLYFKPWMVEDLNKDDFLYDLTVALAMLAVAALSPGLGALSDFHSSKKKYLIVCTVSSIGCLAAIPLVPQTLFPLILLLFAVSLFMYEANMVFYNSLLYSVTDTESEARCVSGYGVALGYVGSIAGIYLALPFVTGEIFGWNVPLIAGSGRSGAFLPTAALFLLFALPVFFFVRERKSANRGERDGIISAYRSIYRRLKKGERIEGLLSFLSMDFMVKNAANAVIINIGVFCAFVIEMDSTESANFLALVTITAVIGSFALGRLAVSLPLRSLIIAVSICWIVSLALFGLALERWQFWILSALAGVALGGMWTLHRPYLAEMVPREDLGKYFGLYTFTGRGAAVIGPLWWGLFFWLGSEGNILARAINSLIPLNETIAGQLPYRLAASSLALLVLLGLAIFLWAGARSQTIADSGAN